jgi:DnaK suppressor protein
MQASQGQGEGEAVKEKELKRLREKLVDMRDRLRLEIGRRGQSILDNVLDPGANSRVPTHLADHDDTGVMEEIEVGRAQTGMLDQVETALEKLDRGDYGRCESCRGAISVARLEALPFATHCIDCERELEKLRGDEV